MVQEDFYFFIISLGEYSVNGWKKKPDKYQAIRSLFSVGTVDTILETGDTYDLDNSVSTLKIQDECAGLSRLDVMQKIYDWMLGRYRIEYIYSSMILQQLVLPNKSTVALSQVPLGNARSDVVLIDGDISTVYEIKTEHDSFKRLARQMTNYLSVFSKMSVLVPESIYDKTVSFLGANPVGIAILKDDNKIVQMRPAVPRVEHPDKKLLFTLASGKCDISDIIFGLYGTLPDAMTPDDEWKQCRRMFLQAPIDEAYRLTVHSLRMRAKRLSDEVPECVLPMLYFSRHHNDQKAMDIMKEWLSKPYVPTRFIKL